jgi:hypothetical protein
MADIETNYFPILFDVEHDKAGLAADLSPSLIRLLCSKETAYFSDTNSMRLVAWQKTPTART